jgi:hypothetical protein
LINPAQTRKKKAMALPLTLVVLLVVGALVGVSLYLIENMKTTTEMKIHDEARLNAALAGVERGKEWLLAEVDAGHELPSHVTQGSDLSALTPPDYNEIKIRDPIEFELGDITVKVRIFDLGYEFTSDLEFAPGIPPRMFTVEDGSTLRESQSYASSNVAEGSTGAADPDSGRLGSYLIRSEATMNNITKQVEQGILLKK